MCVKNFFDLVKRTSLAMYNSNGFSAVMKKPPTTTTTPSPDQFCTQKGALGRFPITGDTTCTQYAYCYVYNNNIVGQYGSCIGTTIFNPTLQLCVASDGYTCPT